PLVLWFREYVFLRFFGSLLLCFGSGWENFSRWREACFRVLFLLILRCHDHFVDCSRLRVRYQWIGSVHSVQFDLERV
ncbi:hypothetical protein PMAYCL1PPCAC_23666, partial [Pristionchus mayeri]